MARSTRPLSPDATAGVGDATEGARDDTTAARYSTWVRCEKANGAAARGGKMRQCSPRPRLDRFRTTGRVLAVVVVRSTAQDQTGSIHPTVLDGAGPHPDDDL